MWGILEKDIDTVLSNRTNIWLPPYEIYDYSSQPLGCIDFWFTLESLNLKNEDILFQY